jgi:hypothetical protein
MNLKTGKIEEFGGFSIFTSLKDVVAGALGCVFKGEIVASSQELSQTWKKKVC